MVAHRRVLRKAGAQVGLVPVSAGVTGVGVAVGPLLHMVNGDRVQQPELAVAPLATVAR